MNKENKLYPFVEALAKNHIFLDKVDNYLYTGMSNRSVINNDGDVFLFTSYNTKLELILPNVVEVTFEVINLNNSPSRHSDLNGPSSVNYTAKFYVNETKPQEIVNFFNNHITNCGFVKMWLHPADFD